MHQMQEKNLFSELTMLRLTYTPRNLWRGSPYQWLQKLPTIEREELGVGLFAGWCAMRELDVIRCPDNHADRIIEGQRVEIKFSTLWDNGNYVFQQIRDQNYDWLICLGVSPFDAHAWIFSKRRIPFSRLKHQHGGAQGRDTWWIAFKAGSPPHWMRSQTGRLSHVYKVLSALKDRNA